MPNSKIKPIILPQKYYHQYFTEVLSFVKKYSAHLMGPEEKVFILDFNKLSMDAQCLFIRLSNRRGPYFRLDKLKYDEISSIEAATKELKFSGFISSEFDLNERIFEVFTKGRAKSYLLAS